MRNLLLVGTIALRWTLGGAAEGPDPERNMPANQPALSVEGRLPSLDGATTWINSQPLTSKGLRGKVVLVQFWTYTCINWRRTAPYLRAWAHKYNSHGLVVVGVHTPEFTFEKNPDLVRRNTTDLDIEYPVAIDSSYEVWTAFANRYWPALYFVDASGRIRHHVFGEGRYEESERVIQELLLEAGASLPDRLLASVDARGAELDADWSNLRSPETYLGFGRLERFSSTDRVVRNKSMRFETPPRLKPNTWGLSGDWTIKGEYSFSDRPGGRLAYQLLARDVHLVMAPSDPSRPVRFRVLIDGKPPGAAHGVDIDEEGFGSLEQPRMYQLIRQIEVVQPVRFEIEFLDAGAQIYALTFG